MDDKAEAIALGNYAQQIIDDPFFQRLFQKLEQKQLDAWRLSPARDIEGREKIWQYLKTLELIKSELSDMASIARNQQALLTQENEKRKLERQAIEEVAARLDSPVEIIEEEMRRKD